MVAELCCWVNTPSPSGDKDAVDGMSAIVARAALDLGGQLTRHPVADWGDHLQVEWGSGDQRPVLLLAHLDTVYNDGGLTANPLRQEGNRLYGPGSFDMKAGALAILWAIKALQATGQTPRRPVVALFTSDEEVGSPSSRALIEAQADRAAAALVLEPPLGSQGMLKTWRKGAGNYRLEITGRAAHAGVAPETGVHAIAELAYQVLALHALADPAAGTSVSVGTCAGGSRVNVIPEQAVAEIDVRVRSAAEAARIEAALAGLQPVVPGARLSLSGGMHRPPMPREQAQELFALAARLAAGLGFTVEQTGTGGVSDGNFTAARGCPTLDGLGAVGDGAHSPNEHILVDSLPERTALLAHLLLAL